MALDAKAALTRKIGPLPAWGWGVAIGGAMLAVKMLRGGGSTSKAERETILVPTGAPSIPADYIGQLGNAVDQIRSRLGGIESALQAKPAPGNPITPPTPKPGTPPISATPSSFDLGTYIVGLRKMFPDLAKTYRGPRQTAGESPSQRKARLNAELAHFGHRGATDLGVYVAGLRAMLPQFAAGYRGPKQAAGETRSQRDARLRAERAYYESKR